MNRVSGDTWVIKDQDEFWASCACAKPVTDYVDAEHASVSIQWFFDVCYANWKSGQFTVIFKCYDLPEYKHHVLSVEASQTDTGHWNFRVIKKITGNARPGVTVQH